MQKTKFQISGFCVLISIVFLLGSCKKNDSGIGPSEEIPYTNTPPIGFKFPAVYKGKNNYCGITVYNKGIIEPYSPDFKTKYFSPFDNFDITMNNPSLPLFEFEHEFILGNRNWIIFNFPHDTVSYRFRNGVLEIETGKIFNGDIQVPCLTPMYQGNYSQLINYTYYLNIDGFRMVIYSLFELNFLDLIQVANGNYFTHHETKINPKQSKIAIATYKSILNHQN